MYQSAGAQKAVKDDVSLVIIVDDDDGVVRALTRLFNSAGLRSCSFKSPEEMLKTGLPDCLKCLILDVKLPGINGIDFQAKLISMGVNLQTIFMTGYGDISMTVRAMKAGAVDFLIKPFHDQDMLDAITAAFDRDRIWRTKNVVRESIVAEYATLSQREREVMLHVSRGLMNKQIGSLLGLSEITIKVHRGSVMRKMGARSVPDLIRKTITLGLRVED